MASEWFSRRRSSVRPAARDAVKLLPLRPIDLGDLCVPLADPPAAEAEATAWPERPERPEDAPPVRPPSPSKDEPRLAKKLVGKKGSSMDQIAGCLKAKKVFDKVEPFDSTVVSGVLLDYFVRLQGRARRLGLGNGGFPRSLEVPRTVEEVVKTIVCLDFEGCAHGDHRDVKDHVRQEQLRFELLRAITKEQKQRGVGGGGWAKTPASAFRSRAKQLCQLKAEVRYFEAQVQNWLLTSRLLHKHVRPAPREAYDQKLSRVEFWLDWHRCRRLSDDALQRTGPGTAGRPPGRSQKLAKSESLPGLRVSTATTLGTTATGGSGASNGTWDAQPGDRASPPASASQARFTTTPPATAPADGRSRLPAVLGRGRTRYLDACTRKSLVPMPLPFVLGATPSLQAANKDLTDRDLLAITELLKERRPLEEVDLSMNGSLTDVSMVPFLTQLLEHPMVATLRRLVLNSCVRLSHATVQATAELLRSADNLRHLDLSHILLGVKSQLALCEAVVQQPCLESLNIADTGMHGSVAARRCIVALFAEGCKLKMLDMSWNALNCETFACLGACVATSRTVKILRLSRCAATAEAIDSPVSFFAEQLAGDATLTELDLSNNQVDFRTALVLEDALGSHKRLRRLILQDNPLGVLGTRSVIRLLANPKSGLLHFDTERCHSGLDAQSSHPGGQRFNPSYPGGSYVLDLGLPYHRALLRMLYGAGEKVGLAPEAAFQSLVYSEKGFAHAARVAGVWQVPNSGTLSFTFNVGALVGAAAQGCGEAEFGEVLRRWLNVARLRLGRREVIPLLARWRELEGRKLEQLVFLSALGSDFEFPASVLEYISRSCPALAEFVSERLLPSLPGDAASEYIGLMGSPTIGVYLRAHRKTRPFLDFCADNPTARYRLELGDCAQYAVAQQLLLLDRWEAIVDKRTGRPDISSRGNGSHLRNEVYQGEPLHQVCSAISDWQLPPSGLLDFDYASNQRPAPTAVPVGADTMTRILSTVHRCKAKPESKLATLRSLSKHVYLTCLDMRQLLGFFGHTQHRLEAFVIFYMRIVDLHNSKLFRVRFERPEELTELQERLGFAAFFPFVQPENVRFELNLEFYDQRLCLSILRQLEVKEGVDHNLCNYCLIRADGSEHTLNGVPYSWESCSEIPTSGTFSATYRCAPEHRNFEARKKLAKTYGCFPGEFTTGDVSWRTGLLEVPTDVLFFMEFLVRRYPGASNVDAAFYEIGGSAASGVITLRELETFLRKMGCHRFSGATPEVEAERVHRIFRHLDPGGEGSISLQEWQVLNQLWTEFDMCVREFVQVLIRIFGKDLRTAWEFIADVGIEDMSEGSFVKAIIKLGYFGPTKMVFSLLDEDDNGRISKEEFLQLERYKSV